MKSDPRYLTKSRFKLALECPTKLAYAGDPAYANASVDDNFLAALAEGGHQVGALACAMFPSGISVDETGHAAQVARTRELLAREDVTIFEAAFEAEGLFVRVDKRGDDIELIEVKAKSWRPGRKLDGDFLPYLHDIAFQRHVVGLACPQFRYRCFLMLVDTSKRTSVDGLADRFRVLRHGGRVRVETAPGTSPESLGDPILTAVPVDEQVQAIRDDAIDVGAIGKLGYTDGVRRLAQAYRDRLRLPPRPTAACASCEFRTSSQSADSGLRSGFHECWSERFGLDADAIAAGTVLDLWNFRRKQALIDQGTVRLSQVTTADIGFDGTAPGLVGMGPKHRQWYQASGQWPGNDAFHLGRDGLRAERATWRFPLHFIDFETCASPIPFLRGRAPYETNAFQFSHHVMHADGRVEHRSQYLDARPGRHPNIDFLRALHRALGSDGGTVFRWAAHENTVLCQIRQELMTDEAPPDVEALIAFVDTLTTRTEGKYKHVGERSMVDLCELAERFYFHPSTGGSSSLKKVLPALMRTSAFLRELYEHPIYGAPSMPSLNFAQPVAWWQEQDGTVCDPYRLLPPIFENDDEHSLPPQLKDGGAAMAAYALLQSRQLPIEQRHAIKLSLLRYCELDTLAMVMTVQAWNAWLDAPDRAC